MMSIVRRRVLIMWLTACVFMYMCLCFHPNRLMKCKKIGPYSSMLEPFFFNLHKQKNRLNASPGASIREQSNTLFDCAIFFYTTLLNHHSESWRNHNRNVKRLVWIWFVQNRWKTFEYDSQIKHLIISLL